MKTLLLCPELFSREGGIQRILRLYLKAIGELAAAGDEVRLVVLNDREFPPAALARYGTDRLGRRHPCAGSKLRFIWRTLQCAAGADRVICGHLGLLPVARFAQRLHPRLNTYLVAHGIEVWRPYSPFEQRALRGARRVFCVSDYTRGEMLRRTGLPAARFTVVPNTLEPDFELAPPSGAPAAGAPVILCVARLDSGDFEKGVDRLIGALPAVRAAVPAARLRIVGTGSDLPRLRRLAGGSAASAAIEFTGCIDDPALRAAYRDCALFALPSPKEGFGLVYLEAMAQGRPCLGVRAGGVPEVIDDTCGVLVDDRDDAQLAAKLVWALQQPWNPAQIRGRAARFSFPVFKENLRHALELAP